MLSVHLRVSSTVALAVNRPFAMYAQRLVQRKRQGILRKPIVLENAQAAQAHYVWVRASEVIWSEYTRIIGILSDAK